MWRASDTGHQGKRQGDRVQRESGEGIVPCSCQHGAPRLPALRELFLGIMLLANARKWGDGLARMTCANVVGSGVAMSGWV